MQVEKDRRMKALASWFVVVASLVSTFCNPARAQNPTRLPNNYVELLKQQREKMRQSAASNSSTVRAVEDAKQIRRQHVERQAAQRQMQQLRSPERPVGFLNPRGSFRREPGSIRLTNAERDIVPDVRFASRAVEGPVVEEYAAEHLGGPPSHYPPHGFHGPELPCDGCDGFGCDGCDGFGSGCESCFGCGPSPCCSLSTLEVFVGAQGALNPRYVGVPGRAGEGSFGFHQGINWGVGLLPWSNIHGQVGVRLTQSNFSGSSFTDDNRAQFFFTAGVFRRSQCGLQGGVVIDYLRDNWYLDIDLAQVRTEISWALPRNFDIGFRYTGGTGSDTERTERFVNVANRRVTFDETWRGIDTYRFFVRSHYCNGGDGMFYGGLSDNSDGVLGAKIRLPFQCKWALQAGVDYLIPQGQDNPVNSIAEGWNVGVSLIWYRRGIGRNSSRQRPMFDVADNGSFFIERTSPP